MIATLEQLQDLFGVGQLFVPVPRSTGLEDVIVLFDFAFVVKSLGSIAECLLCYEEWDSDDIDFYRKTKTCCYCENSDRQNNGCPIYKWIGEVRVDVYRKVPPHIPQSPLGSWDLIASREIDDWKFVIPDIKKKWRRSC